MSGECQCKGGKRPSVCKHFFSLLCALVDYSTKELYAAPTEKLQAWHVPHHRKVDYQRVPLNDRHSACSAKENLHATVDFGELLPLSLLGQPRIFTVDKESEDVFYNSTPLPAFDPSGSKYLHVPNMPLDYVLYYHENVCISVEEVCHIEKETRHQDSALWISERRKRITASNIYKIIACDEQKKMNLSHSLLNPADLSQIPAIENGKNLEPIIKNLLDHKYSNYIFRVTGLCIHPHYPFIAASPDGFLFNDTDPMIVEIKTVFNTKCDSLEQLVSSRKQFCLELCDGAFRLKANHQYYYQIQCQLFCSNTKRCLFALFYAYSKPLHTEVIHADPNFILQHIKSCCWYNTNTRKERGKNQILYNQDLITGMSGCREKLQRKPQI